MMTMFEDGKRVVPPKDDKKSDKKKDKKNRK